MAEDRVPRRLAAILAADMVGYSRLMGIDEAGTVARQKAHRAGLIDPKIADHNGRIVKTTGDGLLVEFASAVDAVQCAVAVQQAMADREAGVPEDRRIVYRIGINVGDIIIDGDDILGDGVNVAARLEALAEPGGVCISGTVFAQVKNKVAFGFADLGPQEVKNIAEPVPTYRVLLDDSDAGTMHAVPQRRRGLALVLASALLAVVVVAGGLWWQPWTAPDSSRQTAKTTAPTTKPSIAVLPFANMSGDKSQEYFSDGLTADLTTDLSRVSGLFVIARNAAFAFKGTSENLWKIARELGASHVLTGSVRRAGKRIRVNVQLIEAKSGYQIWADRYDRELSDVFALQDDITQKIVSALSVKLKVNEKARLSRSAKVNPEAYDMLLRGLDSYRRLTADKIVESRSFFRRAVALDPNFARAHADLALTYVTAAALGFSANPKASINKALEIAERARRLDETVPQVHFVLAAAYRAQRQHEKAITAARRAVALDPNYADGYFQIAINLNYAGNPREGLAAIKKAMRLNPRHPFFYVFLLGQSQYLLSQYKEALIRFQQVKKSNPEFVQAHKFLAATYVALGRTEDAEWAIEELKTLIPNYSIKRELFSAPFKDKFVLDLYIARLKKAGLK